MRDYIYSNQEGYFNKFMAKVFGFMFLGLLVTGVVAYLTIASGLFYQLYMNALFFFVPFIVQMACVFLLTARLQAMSKGGTLGAFLLYSAVTGVTFSTYLMIFGGGLVFIAFIFTAIVFGCMAIIGFTTNADLTKYTSFFRVALLSLIFGTLASMLFHISFFDMCLCYAGLFIFLGLTAVDMQNIKNAYSGAMFDDDTTHKLAITTALGLYLDFINIFIRVVQILGRNQND